MRDDVSIGLNTPFSISVRSSASIAGRAVVGSSRSAHLAVMWNVLTSVRRSGGRLSRVGYVRVVRVSTGRGVNGSRVAELRVSRGSSSAVCSLETGGLLSECDGGVLVGAEVGRSTSAGVSDGVMSAGIRASSSAVGIVGAGGAMSGAVAIGSCVPTLLSTSCMEADSRCSMVGIGALGSRSLEVGCREAV